MGFLGNLFEPSGLTPHGFCLLWQPGLIWLHTLSDGAIAVAYFSIPVALSALVRRRTDLDFGWIYLIFAAFILSCGVTHVMSIVTLWHPLYALEGVIKAVTAGLSLTAAFAIWLLMPRLLVLPSPTALRDANTLLSLRIAESEDAERRLRESEERLRQSQKMEAIGKLTGGIAHDFNNMLTVIDGNLDRLQQRLGDDAQGLHLLEQADLASNRASSLITQLLAFSRKQRLEPQGLDAFDVIIGMQALLLRIVGEQIVLTIEDGGPCWCLADRNQLEAGVVNLVINATQAIQDAQVANGSIRIVVANSSFRVGDDWRHGGGEPPAPGDYVRVSVGDNGTGMSEEVRSRALEPFFTTKPVGKGSGLGLSQTYGFVCQSDGAMRIDSAPGRGTVVELLLPRVIEPQAAADGGTAAGVGVRPMPEWSGGRTVLVVEDEAAVLEVTASTLRDSGYAVIGAADAASALRALDAAPHVALVFTDIVMPGQSGVEMAAEMWARRPALPIVFASGYSEASLTRQLPAGAKFIKKPYKISAVIAMIESALAGGMGEAAMAGGRLDETTVSQGA